MAARDFSPRIDERNSVEEFSSLAQGFNTMADALQRSYQGLEAKVAERTAALSAALCLCFSAGAIAAPMSKADYSSAKDGISAKYKTDKAACQSMSGNAKALAELSEIRGKAELTQLQIDAVAGAIDSALKGATPALEAAAQ